MTVTYDGAESRFDMENITFAEARAIEKVSGVRFAQMQSDAELFANMEVMQAIVWVVIKRSRPGFKFSDLDDVPMGAVNIALHDDDGGDAADPQDSPESDDTGD